MCSNCCASGIEATDERSNDSRPLSSLVFVSASASDSPAKYAASVTTASYAGQDSTHALSALQDVP
eukprot:1618475-Lingulodinium_polyedra.AAC.1